MLDVVFPLLVFLVVLVFYVNVRYHRQIALNHEILVAGSSDDIEEISRLKVPLLFHSCVQCAADETSRMAEEAQSGAELVNSSTGVSAPVTGNGETMSLGRHSLVLLNHSCLALSDSGRPPITVTSRSKGIYMHKGSRTPSVWNLALRECICVTGGTVVCELLPPASVDRSITARNTFGDVNIPSDSSMAVTTNVHAGDILIVPQFWGWRLVATSESSVETVAYETVMGFISRIPETLQVDFGPSNEHGLQKAMPAKKRVRWKESY
jgi:hypothetical protein